MHAATFAALGEPSRLRIVELLRGGPRTVGDIAETLGIRQPQVSKHLRVLGDSDLVGVERRAKWRVYHLQAEPFDEVGQWVNSFERLWDARLDSLGKFLDTLQSPNTSVSNTADSNTERSSATGTT